MTKRKEKISFFFFLIGKKRLALETPKAAKAIRTKYTNNALKNEVVRRQKKTFPLLYKQPIYKINYRYSVILYIHPTPIHKSIHE